MTASITPATRINQPVWQGFHFFRRTPIANGAFAPNFTLVLDAQNLDVLGDADGHPLQILNLGAPGWNENLEGDAQVATLLGEVVTREDGTKLSVAALLDSLLMSRAANPVPPAPVQPPS